MAITTDEKEELLGRLRCLHEVIREEVMAARDGMGAEGLAVPVAEEEDTIYRIDRVSERVLVEQVERAFSRWRLTLVAEGLGTLEIGGEGGPDLRLIVDPLDGTRPIMHDKRSAWILSGLAEDRGDETGLDQIFLAVMTEIPTTRQWRADQYWAIRGRGMTGESWDVLRGGRWELRPCPSRATTLDHGFAQVCRFFPGVKEELASIEEEVFLALQGRDSMGKGHIFEDQYTSTGGQLAELISGRDRFVADLRPLLKSRAKEKGLGSLLCCHPYDLCTELIAREAGVLVEKPGGGVLDAPLDVHGDVAWVGYANSAIRNLVVPHLERSLERRGLL